MEETTSKIQETEERAREYFRQGLNCAECVLLSFLETHDTGYSSQVVGLASGFGGGIGQTRHICGAISATVMALGSVKGRKNPMEKETPKERSLQLRQELYPQFSAMIQEIEAHFGSIECRDLTRNYEDFDGAPRRRGCMEIIAYCAALVARYGETNENCQA